MVHIYDIVLICHCITCAYYFKFYFMQLRGSFDLQDQQRYRMKQRRIAYCYLLRQCEVNTPLRNSSCLVKNVFLKKRNKNVQNGFFWLWMEKIDEFKRLYEN
jgi:hypothetical protein